jgi:hypothetical protein
VGALMLDSSLQSDGDIDVILSDLLSPAAQGAALAEFAQEVLAEAERIDADMLGGAKPAHVTFLDGAEVDELDPSRVKPDSIITFAFDIAAQVATWIEYQLVTHSPVRTGRYQKSHRIYADGGDAVEISDIPANVRQLVFAPIAPYARPIELGESRQSPDGVYQSVAALARQQFAGIDIGFGYREIAGLEESEPERIARPTAPRDLRQPAIIVNF